MKPKRRIVENEAAKKLLATLRRPEEQICITVVPDKKGAAFTSCVIKTTLKDYDSIAYKLEEHNANDRGIHFTVNPGGTKRQEITEIRALFIDIDDVPLEEQKKRIRAFPIRPSLVVRTRRGYHVYWKVKDIAVGEFEMFQKALIKQFGADPVITNPNRCMRLPGFYNCKDEEPVLTALVCYHPERIYTKADFEAVLELEPLPSASAPAACEHTLSDNINAMLYGCDFIRFCRQHAYTLSEPLWQAMITNIACFNGGDKVIHEYSSPYPAYSKEETDRKIEAFMKSASGPITCDTINDRGFICPRKAAGECSCKAPAAMIYDLNNPKTVEAICRNAEYPKDPIDKIKVCETLITEVFGEISDVQANLMLTKVLKEAAGLSTDDIRELKKQLKVVRSAPPPVSSGADKYYRMDNKHRTFMPDILADDIAKEVPLIFLAGNYYLYSNGVYKHTDDRKVAGMIRDRMLTGYIKDHDIRDCLSQLGTKTFTKLDKVSQDKNIINVRNGLYNIETGSLSPHTPEYISLVQLPVSFVPDAECPVFMSMLRYALPEDQIILLQEIMGYLLIPEIKAHKAFVLFGATRAGKSVILRVIRELLIGSENCSAISWQELGSKFTTAELYGKQVNIFADLPTASIEDNHIFLSITGGDTIEAERKYQKPFEFQCLARMVFSCNTLPKNYNNRSNAFYERLVMIRFDKTVPKEERDLDLFDKLRPEADGIFNFALKGLERLITNKFVFSETAENDCNLKQYMEESSPVLMFINDHIVEDPEGQVFAQTVYNSYCEYCKLNGYNPLSAVNFIATLRNYFPKAERKKSTVERRWCWYGIRAI